MSAAGIVSFADHDDDGVADDSVVSDCQTFADGLIVGILSPRYTAANVALASIIVEISAVVTLRELCLRRGNPPPASLEARYQEIMAEGGLIDRIAAGKVPLVNSDGVRIAQRNGFAPSHANLMVDRLYAERRIRVVDSSSNMTSSLLRRDVDRFQEPTP